MQAEEAPQSQSTSAIIPPLGDGESRPLDASVGEGVAVVTVANEMRESAEEVDLISSTQLRAMNPEATMMFMQNLVRSTSSSSSSGDSTPRSEYLL